MCDDSFDLSPGIDSDADLKSRRTKLKRGKRLWVEPLAKCVIMHQNGGFRIGWCHKWYTTYGLLAWRMLCRGCYRISIVLASSCGRAKTIRISYVRTVIFPKTDGKKISVLKNIRIRVDGTSVWTLFLWFLCGNFPHNKLRLLFILKHFFYSGCYPLFSLTLHYPFFAWQVMVVFVFNRLQ